MGDAKQLIVKPISAKDANRIVRQLHYSGKVCMNSALHLGVFMGDRCGGAMQFGPSLDKRKMLGLVTGTLWNEFLELNRMAFADWLPRNGESRCIGYAMRFIRKHYPWVKWVVSFADGTQCGDGTIYRASGFVLTSCRENTDCWIGPETAPENLPSTLRDAYNDFVKRHGAKFHNMTLQGGERHSKEQEKLRTEYYRYNHGGVKKAALTALGCVPMTGFQLRYIYFLDPTARDRLTVPVLPFSEIDKRGAGMYKGKQRLQSCAGSIEDDAPANQAGDGGSNPTPALHHSGGENA